MVTLPFARNSTELSDHGFNLTVSEAASDFLVRRGIKNDGENRAKSGLNFWHKSAEKVDIHTRSGLDKLIDLALGTQRDIILADMGAGSGAVTYQWFADIYPELGRKSDEHRRRDSGPWQRGERCHMVRAP
jgi:hypothetical protein